MQDTVVYILLIMVVLPAGVVRACPDGYTPTAGSKYCVDVPDVRTPFATAHEGCEEGDVLVDVSQLAEMSHTEMTPILDKYGITEGQLTVWVKSDTCGSSYISPDGISRETTDPNCETRTYRPLCMVDTKKAVLHNEPSSSFLLLNDGRPMLLVDMGLGVLYSYRNFMGQNIPDNIFLTHNHSDHTGDLPVFFGILAPKLLKSPKKMLGVIAAPEVMRRVKEYRMHEIVSQVELATKINSIDPLANWVTSDPTFSEITYLDAGKEFGLKTIQSQHSEICYGFVLYQHGHPILGYSADSGYYETLYSAVFEADMVIVDARTSSSYEHASFAEVDSFTKLKQHKNVYVIGYGREDEGPSTVSYTHLKVLETGSFYSLGKNGESCDNSRQYPSLETAVAQ